MIIDLSENFINSSSSSKLQSSIIDLIKIRRLNPNDLNNIRDLCEEWFPVRYPDYWYKKIVNNEDNFFSIVATLNNQIVALLIIEIRSYKLLNNEDYGFLILNSLFNQNNIDDNINVAYILTIGVVKKLRRLGLATLLIKNLINLLQQQQQQNCYAIYLHVLRKNTTAIKFYEKLQFKRWKLLPLYYLINNLTFDGYQYVYYLDNNSNKRVNNNDDKDLIKMKKLQSYCNGLNFLNYFKLLMKNFFTILLKKFYFYHHQNNSQNNQDDKQKNYNIC